VKYLISAQAFIIVSVLMIAIGLGLDLLAWFHLIAKSEPPLVVHLSTAALIFSGYGNIISSQINKKVEGNS
jgi:hypothetical protein